MRELTRQIEQVIREEIVGFRRLIELAEEEHEILLEGEHQRLMQTAEEKLSLCQELMAKREKRRQLIASLAPGADSHPSLELVEPHLEPGRKGPFRQAVAELAALAKRLGRLSDTNRLYLEEALDTVEHLLAIMTGVERDPGGKEGPYRGGKAPNLPRFLAKEV